MATIDDFGDVGQPLDNPALGGPTGWAAAIRDFIQGLPAQIAGKVSKTGDTMTGALTIPTPTATGHAATKGYVDSAGLEGEFVQHGTWLVGGGGDSMLFPVPFAGTPHVTATAQSVDALTVVTAGVTGTGFTARVYNLSGVYQETSIDWVAVGPR